MDFRGTTVLVTGASRGIGRAVAVAFLNKGARVVGVSTGDLVGELPHPQNYSHIVADLSEENAAQRIIDQIPESCGDISVLVNNAGLKVETEFSTSTTDNWDLTLDVNLRAPYFLTQSLAPILAKSGNGRVINITSQSGVAHVKKSIEYGLSKAGLNYITKSLAKVLAPQNITVNAISPGRTYTDMTGYDADAGSAKLRHALEQIPLRAINTPEEIAEITLFLASPVAHNITSQIIGVDGGEANF